MAVTKTTDTKSTSTPSAPSLHDEHVPLFSYQEETDIPIVDALPIEAVQQPAYVPPSFSSDAPEVHVSSILIQPQPLPGSTVVVSTFVPEDLGREPVKIKCPYCKREGYTRATQEMSIGTLLWMIFSVLLFWPLIFCVCCCNKLQDTIHRCRYCSRIVGKTYTCSDCC